VVAEKGNLSRPSVENCLGVFNLTMPGVLSLNATLCGIANAHYLMRTSASVHSWRSQPPKTTSAVITYRPGPGARKVP
jgi:hypothetical protein